MPVNKSNQKKVDWVHRLILPCSEVTRILAVPAAQPLPVRKRIALRVHMALCRFCARFERQLPLLRRALDRHPHAADTPPATGLSPAACDRIREKLSGKSS
jgi:hypothetical protein